jgi:hypothetical protein
MKKYGKPYDIVRSFKFILKVGVDESIVNAPRITDHGSAVLILRFYTNGAFSIDSPTPTLRINLNERTIHFIHFMFPLTKRILPCTYVAVFKYDCIIMSSLLRILYS